MVALRVVLMVENKAVSWVDMSDVRLVAKMVEMKVASMVEMMVASMVEMKVASMVEMIVYDMVV